MFESYFFLFKRRFWRMVTTKNSGIIPDVSLRRTYRLSYYFTNSVHQNFQNRVKDVFRCLNRVFFFFTSRKTYHLNHITLHFVNWDSLSHLFLQVQTCQNHVSSASNMIRAGGRSKCFSQWHLSLVYVSQILMKNITKEKI